MRSGSGLGRKFNMSISEPCKGHFVNYTGRSEILSVLRFFRDSALGALPFFNATWLRHPLKDSRLHPGAVKWLGAVCQLVSSVVVFACVLFLLLSRKRDIVGHIQCWTHIFTDAYILEFICLNFRMTWGRGINFLISGWWRNLDPDA